jgi:hypothetical protein
VFSIDFSVSAGILIIIIVCSLPFTVDKQRYRRCWHQLFGVLEIAYLELHDDDRHYHQINYLYRGASVKALQDRVTVKLKNVKSTSHCDMKSVAVLLGAAK